MDWLIETLRLTAVGTIVGGISGAIITARSNKKLQVLKSEIDTKLEKLKIYENQSAMKKSEQIEKIWNQFINMTDLNNLKPHQRETKFKEMRKEMNKLFIQIFMYASDNTVKRFMEWKNFNLENRSEDGKYIALVLFAKFVIEYRKDLGYSDTSINHIDLLSSHINDFDSIKDKLEKYL
ncbi:hypothetical protein MOF13_08315 [Bacillus spizizenii]|nr:hypothetical protein [Bacillus spizizenii]MCY9259093.1 hypothetical protein [Bacillus spizizenii]MCY9425586.1 hypothetical protein [Bacillus spizizenii]MCY9429305.1 hypothetical protein [Bacillus spizizenii]